jgi:hypothetical protein
MAYFAHQVERCCDRGCGVPLRARGAQDSDAVYDVSPSWVDVIGTPKGKVSVRRRDERPPQLHELTDYVGLRLKGER